MTPEIPALRSHLGRLFLIPLLASPLGCLEDQPSPDLGDCAEPPGGSSWEYGQIGIGSCLAAPSDLAIRPDPVNDDNHFVLVVNSNARSNFSGSSLLSIDASSIDLSCPVNGMNELLTSVLPMEEFAGRIAFTDTGLALLSQRQTGGEEGVLTDLVFTIDASDPRHLAWSPSGPNSWGPYNYITVPADPWAIEINPWDGRAWVLSLTHHLVNAIDLVSDPIAFVDLRGDRSVSSATFIDADGSGSSPDFRLLGINPARLRNETLSVNYFGGTTRLYLPSPPADGGPWVLAQFDSGDGVDFLPVPGPALLEPSGWAAGGFGAVSIGIFDDGLRGTISGEDENGLSAIGRIETGTHALDWTLRSAPILEHGAAGSWDESGVWDGDWIAVDGTFHVVYSGGDGWGSGIGHATGPRLRDVERSGNPALADAADGLILAPDPGGFDSEAVFAPSLLRQPSSGMHLLYYSGHGGIDRHFGIAEVGIGLAVGAELTDLRRTELGIDGSALVLAPGLPGEWDSRAVAAPSVFFDNGRYQMWYQGYDGEQWRTGRAESVDGYTWVKDPRNPVHDGVADPGQRPIRAFAFKASPGGFYRMDGPISGSPDPVVYEGIPYDNSASPLLFEVVGGQALGRGERGSYDADGAGGPASVLGSEWMLYQARSGQRTRLALAQDLGSGLRRLAVVQLSGFEGDYASINGSSPTRSVARPSAALAGAEIIAVFDEGGDLLLARGEIDPAAPVLSADRAGPLLIRGETGAFDDVGHASPSLVLDGPLDSDWLFFHASDGEDRRIGVATAPSGAGDAHPLDLSAPVLSFDRGPAGAWDDASVSEPSVLWDEQADLFRLWYVGYDGSGYRIGYAEGAPDLDGITWSRNLDADGIGQPVFDGGSLSFAADGVFQPEVRQISGGFEMLFEARLNGVARIGRARSPDGRSWTPLTNPTTAGDRFELVVRSGDEDSGTGIQLGDGGQRSRFIDGFIVHGAGASDLLISPDGAWAFVSNKRSANLIVLDIRDDSTPTWLDANYGDIEAIIPIPQRAGMVGIRTMRFSADGSSLWVTLGPLIRGGGGDDSTRRGPEALLEIDWLAIPDEAEAHAEKDDMVLSYLPTGRGVEEDVGLRTDVSVGPGSFALSRDGQRAYVSNFNDNSVYIMDLGAGARGAVIDIIRGFDENPFDVALSPDETKLYVANSFGVADGETQHSTLQILDVDEDSPRYGEILTTLTNLSSRAEAGCAPR